MTRRKVHGMVAAVLSLGLSIAACEAGLRVLHYARNRLGSATIQEITLDDRFGWRATENLIITGWLQDASGNLYFADVRTDAHGFRIFGNPDGNSDLNLLVIGDSFTHALQVSADRAYYSLVGADLGVEVSAYGVGGYGTLQELLALEDQLKQNTPQAVLLQFCSNDFVNNHFNLELRSRYNNNGLLRPYYERNGEIVFRVPKRPASLRKFAARHSRFLYFIFSRIDIVSSHREGESVESVISRDGLADADFAESVEITGQLLKGIRNAVPPDVPVFVFCVDDFQPPYDLLHKLAEANGLVFIDGVPQAIRVAEERGLCTRAKDGGHWNEYGHKLAASVLSDFLANHWIKSGNVTNQKTFETVNH